MDLSPAKVREILKLPQEPVSLETPIGEEDDSHLADFIKDEKYIDRVTLMSILEEVFRNTLKIIAIKK